MHLRKSTPSSWVITMKLPRRNFLHLAAGTALLPAAPSIAQTQTYPTRPVRLIVGFAAGGGADIVARVIAQQLSAQLGQQFVVENRTGAASNIAAETVVNAPPDGYTLILAATANAINATLYDKLTFEFARDIVPVASCVRVPNVLDLNPSVPVRSVSEFIAYAKANPEKLSMGSGGTGTTPHMSGELFMMMTGVKLLHVPYRGEAMALADLLGDHVQLVFGTMPGSIELIRSGKLHGLAVTTRERSEVMPELPTIAEAVPGYESSTWFGIGAPRNTPAEIIDKLNKAVNAVLTQQNIRARLYELGGSINAGSSTDFGKLIADETKKWAKVIKFAGIKPD
jgi:tripartite-type tricarboxylate transporter receptor subunit TctC